MTRSLLVGLALVAILALSLRCPRLNERPMHNDEAVNAIKFGQLWQHGSIRYDPNEHHGPTLLYATLAVSQTYQHPDFIHLSEIKLRLITVLFGLGLVLIVPLMTDGLGKKGAISATLFMAVSPAMVFYSRYYIHEMLLAFFTMVAIAAGWRYWRTRKIGWALLAGAAGGLMHSTKETFVITMIAALLALALTWIWERWLDASSADPKPAPLDWRHISAALAIWVGVAILLFSSFFTNTSGPADSVRTHLPWLHRAGGASPHINPWSFYFQRLFYFHAVKGPIWTEAVIGVLALVAIIAAFIRKGLGDASGCFVRFLSFYTLALTAAYCLIAYKTPWCALSFWAGMILLAGFGASVAIRAAKHVPTKVALRLLLGAAAADLAWQAWQASVPYAADPRNPYVYAQTRPDILNLVKQVEDLSKVDSQGRQMVIKVMSPEGDYWPLPWYFRQFSRVGWWEELASDPFAPVMIVASKLHANLDEKKTHLMIGYFELRPQVFFELYVELDLWKAFLARKNSAASERVQ